MEITGRQAGGLHLELLRSAQLCHPRWNEAGPLTLYRREGETPAWAHWRETLWRPLLRPALDASLSACAAGNAEHLAEVGADLARSLPALASARSRQAGRRLALDYTPPAGERFWKRVVAQFASEAIPPHLMLVMALRAQTFHLPRWQLVRTYLLLEAHGLGSLPAVRCGELVEDCERIGAPASLLRVA